MLSRVNELLDRRLYQATILSQIGRVARSLVHFDETFTSVMGLVAQVVDYTVGGMAFVDEEGVLALLVQNRPAAASVVEEAKARLLQAVAAERPGQPFPKAETRVIDARGGARGGSPEETLAAFECFPISTNGKLAGLLAVGGRAAAGLDADTHAFLAQVANQAHIVVENARLVERLRELAIRDSLTELYNHRHAMDLLASEFERVGRYAAGVSLLMLDLDEFKRINDEHGHPAGDAVLREMARVLKETLRTVDSLGRYGGEEFMAILPHTSPEEAAATAERIRQRVQGHVFWVGTSPSTSRSAWGWRAIRRPRSTRPKAWCARPTAPSTARRKRAGTGSVSPDSKKLGGKSLSGEEGFSGIPIRSASITTQARVRPARTCPHAHLLGATAAGRLRSDHSLGNRAASRMIRASGRGLGWGPERVHDSHSLDFLPRAHVLTQDEAAVHRLGGAEDECIPEGERSPWPGNARRLRGPGWPRSARASGTGPERRCGPLPAVRPGLSFRVTVS